MLKRNAGFAALAVTAALVAVPSAAGAYTLPTLPSWSPPALTTPTWALPAGLTGGAVSVPNSGNNAGATGACDPVVSGGQGPAGNAESLVCQGAGLTFVAPSIGQIASVIGPTIISPAVVGNQIITSAGSVAGQ